MGFVNQSIAGTPKNFGERFLTVGPGGEFSEVNTAVSAVSAPNPDNPLYIKVVGHLDVDNTIILPSYTVLDITGASIKLTAGNGGNIIRNKYAQNRIKADRFSCSGTTCTVTEKRHSRQVGDQVYISGLATNITLNGPQTVTGVSGDTWTFTISDATAPTGYGAISVYNPVSGANFVRASNVVTVTEAGHHRRIGDPVYIEGLLTDTSFNGLARVKSVSGDDWTYDSAGSDGSPTGTANVQGDTSIALIGGEIDWDNDNQSSASDIERFAVVFGNIGMLGIADQLVSNVQKYCYWIFNSTDTSCRHLRFDTDSDGVHFEAPAYNPRCFDISGKVGDDLVAFTAVDGDAVGGLYPGYASPSGLGSWEGIRCSKLFRNEYSGIGAIVKITGNAGYSFGKVVLDDLSGYASTGAIAVVDDGNDLVGTEGDSITATNVQVQGISGYTPSVLVHSATGRWDAIRINGLDIDNIAKDGAIVGMSAAVDIGDLVVSGVASHEQITKSLILISGASGPERIFFDADYLNLGTGGHAIQTSHASLSVEEIHISVRKVTGVLSSSGLVFQNNGEIKRLFMHDMHYELIRALLDQGSGITAAVDVFMTNIYNTSGASKPGPAIIGYGGGNVFLTNCRSEDTVNNYFQLGGGTWNIRGAGNNDINKPALLTSGASTAISISDPSLQIDLDPTVSTKLSPVAGDRVWNNNAAFGTGIGLYGYTNAGAWTQIF